MKTVSWLRSALLRRATGAGFRSWRILSFLVRHTVDRMEDGVDELRMRVASLESENERLRREFLRERGIHRWLLHVVLRGTGLHFHELP